MNDRFSSLKNSGSGFKSLEDFVCMNMQVQFYNEFYFYKQVTLSDDTTDSLLKKDFFEIALPCKRDAAFESYIQKTLGKSIVSVVYQP